MSNFRAKWLQNDSEIIARKNFKLLKYEHIIHNFEAGDPEISNT